MGRLQRLVAKAQPRGGAGGEILQQHVGAGEQFGQDLAAGGVFHVQCYAAFAAVEPNEVAANPVDVIVVVAGEIAAAGPLDLDHIGAKIGEVTTAQRRRHRMLQRDDTHPFQRPHSDGSFVCLGSKARGDTEVKTLSNSRTHETRHELALEQQRTPPATARWSLALRR